MQTKPKQKLTAIIIAFTMILSTMMQLFIPITVHAEESAIDRTVTYKPCISYTGSNGSDITYSWNIDLIGQGHFHVYALTYPSGDGKAIDIFVASDKSFTIENNYTIFSGDTTTPYHSTESSVLKNGFHQKTFTLFNTNGLDIKSISIPKEKQFTSFTDSSNWRNSLTVESFDFTKDDYEEKTFDEVATYDQNIPTPKFKVEKNLRFEFLNNESDYYYEIKGRWYTTDDFYLHLGGFMNAIWLYDYETIYKNDLTEWITYKDKRNTAITGYLKDIGEKSFNDLITKYPIGTRQIKGEKNKDGSYKAGFDHASSNLVMWLKDPTSIYNGIEVYIRYYKVDESGKYTYGKWAHYYNSLAKQNGAEVNDNVLNGVDHNYSDKGLTNDELKDLENSGQSKGDTDIITDYGDNGGGILTEIDKLDEIDFSNVVKVILSLFKQTKSIFNMFTTVLSFMPNWVTELIGVSVVIICLIGIWKALR